MKLIVVVLGVLCFISCAVGFGFELKNINVEISNKFRKALSDRSTRAVLDTCQKNSCATTGQACGFLNDEMTAWATCISDDTFCNMTSKVCEKQKANGQECDDSSQCLSWYCIKEVIANPGVCGEAQRENGERCSTADQCLSDICTGGVCKAIAIGDACIFGAQCDENTAFCSGDDDVCTAVIKLGDECSLTDIAGDDQCKGNYICGVRGTAAEAKGECISQYSTPQGGLCSGSSDCGDGLACTNVMRTPEWSWICWPAAASSKSSCDSDADCAEKNETCECNVGSGTEMCYNPYENNPSGWAKLNQDMDDCTMKHCANDDSDDCLRKNCLDEFCKGNRFQVQWMRDHVPHTSPQCYIDNWVNEINEEINKECNNSASVVALSVVAFVVALFALLA